MTRSFHHAKKSEYNMTSLDTRYLCTQPIMHTHPSHPIIPYRPSLPTMPIRDHHTKKHRAMQNQPRLGQLPISSPPSLPSESAQSDLTSKHSTHSTDRRPARPAQAAAPAVAAGPAIPGACFPDSNAAGVDFAARTSSLSKVRRIVLGEAGKSTAGVREGRWRGRRTGCKV